MKHSHHKRKRRPAGKESASYNPAWERIKERFRKIDRGDVLRTGAWFLGLYALYTLLNHFRFTFHWILYPIFLGLLAVGYLILNGGSFDRNRILTPEDLPAEWDRERKEKAIFELNRRRAWAKRLLPPLIGVVLTLMFDLIYLNVVTL